jgi:hypothetical protein
MIDNPQFKQTAWNPTVAYQFGENMDGVSVAVFTCTGEDGTEVTLMFPDIDYLRGIASLYENAVNDMELAEDIGYAAAAAEIDKRSDRANGFRIPDDLSGLDTEEGA